MVKGGERIMIVESFKGGNKKERKKERLFKGYKGGTKKKRKIVQRVKGRNKKGKKDGELFEREKKGRRKNKREKRKTVQWLEMKKQKRDALERTSLNGYDE